jgi:hypothetical protein
LATLVRWKTDRWTMNFLAFVLDTAAVNATTIYGIKKNIAKPDTRDFRFRLIRSLVTPHMRRRIKRPGMQTRIKLLAKNYLGKISIFQ